MSEFLACYTLKAWKYTWVSWFCKKTLISLKKKEKKKNEISLKTFLPVLLSGDAVDIFIPIKCLLIRSMQFRLTKRAIGRVKDVSLERRQILNVKIKKEKIRRI